MARCLQSLILARSGALAPVFLGIEEYLGHNVQKYFDVLAEVGRGSWQPSNDARPWISFALKAHLNQATLLLRRVRESEKMWIELERIVERHGLPPRTMNVLFDASLRLRVRNSTYRAGLAEAQEEITEQTAGRDLRQLVDLNLLVAMGERRGRHYVAGPQVTEIAGRQAIDQTDPFAE